MFNLHARALMSVIVSATVRGSYACLYLGRNYDIDSTIASGKGILLPISFWQLGYNNNNNNNWNLYSAFSIHKMFKSAAHCHSLSHSQQRLNGRA